MIILLGIISSYSDYKKNIIKNNMIIISIIYSIIINFIYFIYYKKDTYYQDFLINILFSIILAFLFYYFDIWSAGDGKLFIAFTFLIPLSIYQFLLIPKLYSFELLINIFLPYTFILIIIGVKYKLKKLQNIKINNKTIKKTIKSMIVNLIKYLFNLATIVYFLDIIFKDMNINNVIYIILLMLSMKGLDYFFNNIDKKIKYRYKIKNISTFFIFSSMIIFYRLFFDISILDPNNLKNFITYAIILRIMLSALKKPEEEMFTKKIKKQDIKKDMIIHSTLYSNNKIILKKGEKIKKRHIPLIIRSSEKEVLISKKMPFAHLIFLGVIITLILKQNILIYLVNLLRPLISYFL